MLFLFLTTIGASFVLQRRIQREYEGVPDWKLRRQQLTQLEAQFKEENEAVDRELVELLATHRALVARRGELAVMPIKKDLFDEAMEELEEYLARDPLEEAFQSLEQGDGEKKKTKKGV